MKNVFYLGVLVSRLLLTTYFLSSACGEHTKVKSLSY